jgi:hypothetical protein
MRLFSVQEAGVVGLAPGWTWLAHSLILPGISTSQDGRTLRF